MSLSWNELACHGLLKKIDREVVTLIMIHLRPLREKWIKDHGEGEVEKYIMGDEIHGVRELFESSYISKEMWSKAALRREFKSQWWWRAPEKRREKCYNVVNASITRYSASTWPPQPITGMPDELLKNDVHGVYETLDDGRAVERQWDDKWSREKDAAMRSLGAEASWLGTHAILRAKWYQDIHEGRYFLFFKINERLKTMIQRRVGYVDERYCPEIYDPGVCARWGDAAKGVRACDIMGFGSDQQCASDLLTIDGPGLNHTKGKEVMHIDDIFH
jgi:hypothetical protein